MVARRFGFAGSGTFAACAVALSLAPLNAATLFRDNFDCAVGLVASEFTYFHSNCPYGGTASPSNPSRSWEADDGQGSVTNGWLYLQLPVRLNTRRFDYTNVLVSWLYRSGDTNSSSGEARDLWLRYETQFDLYAIQFDRANGQIVAKRKVPACGWSCGTNSIANNGVYYILKTDSESPDGGGHYSTTWSALGMTNLAHDTNTVYRFAASILTKADGTNVQMKLWRDVALVASWTDANDGLGPDEPPTTLAQDLARGCYDSVANWQAEWGMPIKRPGATGFRGDINAMWIGDFRVSTLETNDSRLSARLEGGKVRIDWSDWLQSSDDLNTWVDEPCSVSPMSFIPVGRKFYRVHAEPPTVSSMQVSDNFSFYAVTNYPDGSAFGPWTAIYNGNGTNSVTNIGGRSVLEEYPAAAVGPNTTGTNTHACLVLGPAFTNPLTYFVSLNTVSQLRQGSSPNAWEVGWVIWDYTDRGHFYYFIAETNGWSLGKEVGINAQRFLASGNSPVFTTRTWYNIKIVEDGQNTKTVYVNGQVITNFTDMDQPYTSGQIGLYCEDARVWFTDMTAVEPR